MSMTIKPHVLYTEIVNSSGGWGQGSHKCNLILGKQTGIKNISIYYQHLLLSNINMPECNRKFSFCKQSYSSSKESDRIL